MAAMLSDPWVAAWTTEGPRTSGGTAGGVMPKRCSFLRWTLIAGVLALGIGADEVRAPSTSAVAEAGATAPTTAAPLLPTTTTSAPPDTAPATGESPAGPPYVVATSSAPVTVHAAPDESSSARLLDPAKEVGGQLVFLVKQDGPDWMEVYLPVRPNGSTGWLRPGDVQLYAHDYRIELSLAQRRLVLFEGPSVVMDEPIGVGANQTPTPGGVYYLKELLRPPDPDSFYGPYAYGLSGFSNVLTEFAGGDGVIGLHGTNDPSSVGRSVSNGCIRLRNAAITRMVEDVGLPLGTPVVVRA
ncbi:MAG: L,D-transpeptidase [Actinobacteria bacterium]|nr:L,D-transpeptidase [Actinomycetota bacterium]